MVKDIELKGLKLLLLAELTLEAMDDIKGTDLYKGKLKQHGSIVCNLLNPLLKNQITKVYNVDPSLTTNLFNQLDNLVATMATLNVVDLTMINQIFDHYSAYPEDWQNTFPIELTELKK